MCSRGGSEDSKQTTTPLMIGDTVPDFKLSSNEGKEHRLSDYRGTKILLCFYDYAHCPQCAYSVGKLMGHQKKLAWASKLKVITVFLTNKEILNDGLTHHNAPIPQLCEDNLYPFLALADPDGVAATSFRLGNSKSILPRPRELFFKLRRNSGIGRNSTKFPPLPISNFMPAEFLIDENGIIVDILQAKKANEYIAMDHLQKFLLSDVTKERYLESRNGKGGGGGGASIVVSGL
jgi:peroxiredoxin Q/BCP